MFTPKEEISVDYEMNEDFEIKEDKKFKELSHKSFKKRFKNDLVMNLTLKGSLLNK